MERGYKTPSQALLSQYHMKVMREFSALFG